MPARNDPVFLSLGRDGRLHNPAVLDLLRDRLRTVTDCFVFCHGWLNHEAEAREGAERFFNHLDEALRPCGERVVPLRVAIHWPSKPFADGASTARIGDADPAPELVGALGDLGRREPGALARWLAPLCDAEVSLAPEEDVELDALVHQAHGAATRGGIDLTPLHALSFWLMKRRAGLVGERLGREFLAPALAGLGEGAPRVHLIGHSFGAKLVTSAVLGGVRPQSLVLLLAAFSAFAFAEAVPGTEGPGFYRRVLTERMVAGPIVALRSAHDHALGRLYPAVTWGQQVDRATLNPRRRSRVREVVARSAMGAVGVLDAGAVELDLLVAQRIGLPAGVVTIDGSRVVTAQEWLIGAHRDIYHPEIATLVRLAAGLAAGARPRLVSRFPNS